MAQQVGGEVDLVHPHDGRLGRVDVAAHQGDMLRALDGVAVQDQLEFAAVDAFERRLHHALDKALGAAAIGDQVGDGADLQPVQLGEGDQVGHPRHRPVVLDDLADHPGRDQAGHAADVDGRLGVAGADQDSAVARDQREDVARRDDVVGGARRIGRHLDRMGAIGGRNAGSDAFLGLDRNGEGRAHALAVLGGHRRQAQLLGALGRQGQADQAPRIADHEVDLVRRGELGRNDDVALVLAVLGIHQDVGAAVAGVLDNVLDRADRAVGVVDGQFHHAVSCHRAR